MSKLFKNTSFYTVGNILPKVGTVLILPIVTKYLSPSDYGIVQSVVVLQTFIVVMFTLGVDRAIYRLYFDFTSREEKRNYLGNIFILSITISSLALVLLFSFNSLIDKIYSSISFYPYFSYFILSIFISTFSIIPKAYLQVEQKAIFHFIISLMQFIFKYFFILWFVIYKGQGAFGMIKGFLYGNLLLAPIFIYLILKNVNFRLNSKYISNSLKYSLPFIPSLIAAWVLNFSDRIFLERHFSTAEVGIYSLGYQIGMIISYINQGIQKAYSPIFYQIANLKSSSTAKEKLSKYNNTILGLILFIIFLVVFFSKELITIAFSEEYKDASKIIPIIAITYFFVAWTGILNLSIYQNKKTYITMFITIVTALINILLNYFLIPIYGMQGAAYTTLISFIISYLLTLFYAKREYSITVEYRKLFIVFIVLIILWISSNQILKNTNIFVVTFIKLIFIFILAFYLLFKNKRLIKNVTGKK